MRWAELGERPSSYFLNFEKRKRRERALNAVVRHDGHLVTDPVQIVEACKLFYENLYSENSDNLLPIEEVQEIISNLYHPKLSDQAKVDLDSEPTKEEIKNALDQLNPGKCPGTDGITPEFNSRFWDLLYPFFKKSLAQSFREALLSVQQRRGVVTLIPKKGGDRRYISNWCPITLLNTDYKILTKQQATKTPGCFNTSEPDRVHERPVHWR